MKTQLRRSALVLGLLLGLLTLLAACQPIRPVSDGGSANPMTDSAITITVDDAGIQAPDELPNGLVKIDYARVALPRLGLADLAQARQDEDGPVTCGWAMLHALEHAYLHLGHIQITCQLWRQQES